MYCLDKLFEIGIYVDASWSFVVAATMRGRQAARKPVVEAVVCGRSLIDTSGRRSAAETVCVIDVSNGILMKAAVNVVSRSTGGRQAKEVHYTSRNKTVSR